eukprot:939956-Rhodomonas_salina.5
MCIRDSTSTMVSRRLYYATVGHVVTLVLCTALTWPGPAGCGCLRVHWQWQSPLTPFPGPGPPHRHAIPASVT